MKKNDGRDALSPDVLEVVDSQVMFNDLEINQILRVTALDAKTGAPGKVEIQLVAKGTGPKSDQVVLCILSDDFNFFTPDDDPYGTVKTGSLVCQGLAMQHLPQPRLSMVGFGGIRPGTDFSLECLHGDDQTLILAQIYKIEILSVTESCVSEDDLANYQAKVEETHEKKEAESDPETEASKKKGWLDTMAEKLGANLFKQAIEAVPLEEFSLEGSVVVGAFLVRANEQEKFKKALEVVREGYASQWAFQPPPMRGMLMMGSNESFLRQCYIEADVKPEDLG